MPRTEEELKQYRTSALHLVEGVFGMLGGMALARKMGYGEVHDLAEILAYVGAALTGINLRKGWAYLRMGDDDAVRKSFNSSLDDRVEKD